MSEYCAVGNHAIPANEDSFLCYHCHRRLCSAHMGNPDALPGDLVACVDHVEEVGQQERAFRQSRARNQRGQP